MVGSQTTPKLARTMYAKPGLMATLLIVPILITSSVGAAAACADTGKILIRDDNINPSALLYNLYKAEDAIDIEEPGVFALATADKATDDETDSAQDELGELKGTSESVTDPFAKVIGTTVRYAEGSTPSIDIILDITESSKKKDYWSVWGKGYVMDSSCNVLYTTDVNVIEVTDKWGHDDTGIFTTTLPLVDETINAGDVAYVAVAVGAKHCIKNWGGKNPTCYNANDDDTLTVTPI